MITATDATKRFGNILAVDAVTAEIREGSVFGLIGSNGAGKSTFLRMVAGILRPDSGSLMADGMEIYENPQVKGRVFYISDEQYFYSNTTPRELRDFYASIYPGFDKGRFDEGLRTSDGAEDQHLFQRHEKAGVCDLRHLFWGRLSSVRRDL